MRKVSVDVLIIGAGPTGMACGLELWRLGIKKVMIIEREKEPVGVPRLCAHIGFGMRDLHRLYSGKRYAGEYKRRLGKTGISLLLETTAMAWAGEREVDVTSPRGLMRVSAGAVLLATGCRERPRSARLVPGYRPLGVLNTGSLQDLVNLYGKRIGQRAVVVGSELVSFSAIHTLRRGGCRRITMVTPFKEHQAYGIYKLYKWWSSDFPVKVPVIKNHTVTNILGKKVLEAVEVTDIKTGESRRIECDVVVFTGDWIPEHEIARLGDIEIDGGTKGPIVDQGFRTSRKGIFAAGNLTRGAEPSGVCAVEGRKCARSVKSYLDGGEWPAERMRINVEDPLKWIFPGWVAEQGLPNGKDGFLFRVKDFVDGRSIAITGKGGRILYEKRLGNVGPNYSWPLPSTWLESASGEGRVLAKIV